MVTLLKEPNSKGKVDYEALDLLSQMLHFNPTVDTNPGNAILVHEEDLIMGEEPHINAVRMESMATLG